MARAAGAQPRLWAVDEPDAEADRAGLHASGQPLALPPVVGLTFASLPSKPKFLGILGSNRV